MKKLIIFVTTIFLFCNVSNAQIEIDTSFISGGEYFDNSFITYNRDTTVTFDTVRVLMLMGDTTGYFSKGDVHWEFGYSVRRKECCIDGNTTNFAIYKPVPYYTHVKYLNTRKEPMKEGTIIWISSKTD